MTFRDAKRSLGSEEPQSRTRNAVERTAPTAFVLYGLAVLWYAERGEVPRAKWFVKRPWYRKKAGVEAPPRGTHSPARNLALRRRANGKSRG